MKKYKILIIILLFLLMLIFAVGFFYNYLISPVSKKSEKVIVQIPEGSVYSVGDTLYEKGLIRNVFIYKVYVKVNKVKSLKASTYELDKNMKLKEIIATLSKGNSYNPNEVWLTFPEGYNIRKIAKVIAERTNNSYDDFLKLMQDSTYIAKKQEEYWFLTDDILNKKIYYPLEGFLFPNTYAFENKDVTPVEIADTMLKEMDKQLKKYQDKIKSSHYNIHQLITLASIVELEGATADDRAAIAGVFYNRLKSGWTLGSDVTTYYYLKIDNYKQILDGDKGLYDCDNAYNTRCKTFIGLPVGPIASPGNESLKAVLDYKKHDAYYFVTDCQKHTYLNKDAYHHQQKIAQLKSQQNWCG